MQETDNRSVGEVVIELHDIARTMEAKTALSMKQEAFELRRIADRISHLENIEKQERYKHTLNFTKNRIRTEQSGDDND